MHLVMLDTCVWLDMSSQNVELPMLTALKHLVQDDSISHGQSPRLQPIDNNPVENQIRGWAPGRSNWLFAGLLRSGNRAAAIMSLIQSARMNGCYPYAYIKDVLTRPPAQRGSRAIAAASGDAGGAYERRVDARLRIGTGRRTARCYQGITKLEPSRRTEYVCAC
jgi:hypothetical protein